MLVLLLNSHLITRRVQGNTLEKKFIPDEFNAFLFPVLIWNNQFYIAKILNYHTQISHMEKKKLLKVR